MTGLASYVALRPSVCLVLCRKPYVIGVGLGLKQVEGRATETLAWRVYVTHKAARNELRAEEQIPTSLFGLPTDVIERASPRASSGLGTGVSRAMVLGDGTAIANSKGVPGTLGGLAWHRASGSLVLMSSFHVLFGKQARRGDRVWRLDGPLTAVARNIDGKATTVRLSGQRYFIDAAIAALDVQPDLPAPGPEVPAWRGTRFATPGTRVWKRGAATGDSFGVIVDVCYPDRWHSEWVNEDAPNQILIQPTHGPHFSAAGDSGAVLRDLEHYAVGLLWGCNARGEAVACHMRPVVRALGICMAQEDCT